MPIHLLHHAKRMRKAPTEAEARLWRELRAHRFLGFKFKRQQPIGRYIVDFACLSRKLLIEIDGSQHLDAVAHDEARSAWLQSQGFRVVRFWNHDVLARTIEVMDAIHAALESRPSPGRASRGHPLP